MADGYHAEQQVKRTLLLRGMLGELPPAEPITNVKPQRFLNQRERQERPGPVDVLRGVLVNPVPRGDQLPELSAGGVVSVVLAEREELQGVHFAELRREPRVLLRLLRRCLQRPVPANQPGDRLGVQPGRHYTDWGDGRTRRTYTPSKTRDPASATRSRAANVRPSAPSTIRDRLDVHRSV